MNILVTEPGDIHKDAISLLRAEHAVFFESAVDTKNISALFIRTYTNADKQYLSSFPSLKYILRAGVGLDNVDLVECKKRGITVFNSPGSNANAVAEYVVGVIIMLFRNVVSAQRAVMKGAWRDKTMLSSELKNKTVGIVGCGAIGRLITEKLHAFSVNSVGFDPYLSDKQLSAVGIKKTSLDLLLQSADIVTLHLPLTAETKDLISAQQLKLMKSSAYLINTSRGGIVNEDDLIQALENDTIAGSALDVFENEPEINKKLILLSQKKNLILTPHIGGYTREADRRMAVEVVERFLSSL